MKSQNLKNNYRPEIDALKAYAVCVLIIYNFNKILLPSGFLGVDIFFVLSGYYAAYSLSNKNYKNSFNLIINFYERRLLRLLPALVFFVLATSILSSLLTPEPTLALRTGLTSLFGISNLYLLVTQSTDYFAQLADLNPFTNTWSLGVGMQYYLVFPILYCIPSFNRSNGSGKKNILILFGIISIISITCFFYFYNNNQVSAFFLVTTRFWEITAGCFVFWLRKILMKFGYISPFIVIGGMSIVMFLPKSLAAYSTFLIVFLTSIILIGTEKKFVFKRVLVDKRLVYVGKMSYSLYLWNWSVISISRWTVGIHWWSIPFQILIIFSIAYFSFRFVETPIRSNKWNLAKFTRLLILIVPTYFVAIIVSFLFQISKGGKNELYIFHFFGLDDKKYEHGHLLDCHGKEDLEKLENPFAYCLNTNRAEDEKLRFSIIGDSHASQFYFMAYDALGNSEYEVGYIVTHDINDFPHIFWKDKINNLEDYPTINAILESSRKGDFLAIAFHKGHLNDYRDLHVESNKRGNSSKRTLAFINFEKLINSLKSKGVNLLLITDLPMMNNNSEISVCEMQQKLFKWNMCDVKKSLDDKTSNEQLVLFDLLEKNNDNVFILNLRDIFPFKNDNYTWFDNDGLRVMVDQSHITKEYSKKLSKYFKKFLIENNFLDHN